MANVSLTSEEVVTLREILEGYLGDLRMEIADTDSQDFRENLKATEVFVKSLIQRLDTAR